MSERYWCKDCGTEASEDQKEYNKDCRCGGVFASPETVIASLLKQISSLEKQLDAANLNWI